MGETLKQILVLFAIIGFTQLEAFAQDDNSENEELNIIEVELEKNSQRTAAPLAEGSVGQQQLQSNPQPLSVDFSDLGQLAPLKEVSVIQKKFLPKTGRAQFFIGPTMVTNDPFFNVYGGVLKGSYFFTESIGLELSYFALTGGEAKATKELKEIQNIGTESLVETKSVLAADLVFIPIYGKMTWFNESIVPFDFYFSVGYGATKTQNESPGTLHLATGQIFALTKSSAFRWDLSWNFFNARGIDNKSAAYNNLFLTAGMSWFFPEAKYR
jgi:outer membrane beta-barrel protein